MSRTEAGWLMLLLALVPGWLAGAGPEDRPAEELLAMLVPREEAVAEMHAQVARLGSEEFKVREAAMEVLRQAPVLPREVIERGLASGEPEIVSRLRAIMEGGMRSRSTEVFETALERIVAGKQRGLLEGIAAALDVGVIAGDVALAERAAGVTAEAGDGELLRRLAEDGEAMRRRMAAAGCEALGQTGWRS